jgi:RecB family endonuclease NucS
VAPAAAVDVERGLERDLQAALRTDIERLERGLRLADADSEHSTLAGRDAVTAVGADGATVVIVLKVGTALPKELTQLLAAMSTAAGQGRPVRGLLIARDFHPRTVRAARAAADVQLRRYSYRLAFEAVE